MAHIRTIMEENFANSSYYLRGQELQSSITPYVQQDVNKFYSYSDFVNNIDTTVGGVGTMIEYPGLKDLMEARTAYLQTCQGYQGAPQISTINYSPKHPELNQLSWITAKAENADTVIFAFRMNSTAVFTKTLMFDDGQHHDGIAGDRIYGASFVSLGHTIQYYIYAENDSAAQFSPERAEYEFYTIQPALKKGDLVINEIMVVNTATAKDQDGDYDSWVELQNNTNEAINLRNNFLSDDPGFPDKWTFPDTIIQARKQLIIWADNDNLQEGIHSNFTLAATAGTILLSNNNYEIIDSISYSQQIASKTIGRYPNGYGSFDLMAPTFARMNQIGDTWDKTCMIYPNPANGYLFIETKSNYSSFTISILNPEGQLIRSEVYTHSTHELPVNIDVFNISGINGGIYFVKLEGDGINYISKILIY